MSVIENKQNKQAEQALLNFTGRLKPTGNLEAQMAKNLELTER